MKYIIENSNTINLFKKMVIKYVRVSFAYKYRIEANGNINITTLDKLATCPWHVVMDSDKIRIAAITMKATCTCDSC